MKSTADRTTLGFGALATGLAAGALIATLAGALLEGESRNAGPFPWLPELQADVGDGDFLYFPNRRNIWVVHPQTGRLIHYKFIDTYQGTVERSYVAQIDQKLFPPEDTVYALSERNIEDLLWVCNRRTGDFQLWRRNVRDGRLVTDPVPVQSGRDLLNDRSIRSSEPPSRP